MEDPGYFAIISAKVRYAPIMAHAKLLFGEITALTHQEGYCWANNLYFAKRYRVSVRNIQRWLSELEDHGFITITKGKRGKRQIETYLSKLEYDDPRRKRHPTHDENVIHNNKDNNKVIVGSANKKKSMRIYAESEDLPTIKEGDPTPVKGPAKSKYSKELRADMDELVSYYSKLYIELIDDKLPEIMHVPTIYRNMAPRMAQLGLKRMKELLEVYLHSKDKYYRSVGWDILTFCTMQTLNKLAQ